MKGKVLDAEGKREGWPDQAAVRKDEAGEAGGVRGDVYRCNEVERQQRAREKGEDDRRRARERGMEEWGGGIWYPGTYDLNWSSRCRWR